MLGHGKNFHLLNHLNSHTGAFEEQVLVYYIIFKIYFSSNYACVFTVKPEEGIGSQVLQSQMVMSHLM